MDMLTKDIRFWITEFATGMISKDYLMLKIRRIVEQETERNERSDTSSDCDSDTTDDFW